MENIAQKFLNFRKKLKITQAEMGKMIGVPQRTWANYETGRSQPPAQVLLELAKIGFDYESAFDLGKEDEKEQTNSTKQIDLSKDDIKILSFKEASEEVTGFVIPILDQRLSAGQGADLPDDDRPTAYISVPKYLAKYGKSLVALYVDGDSMEPTLCRGDMIICDSYGWSGEGIYAIQMEGSGFVKRLTIKPGKLVIISDNPIYTTFEVPTESEDIRIIGRVHCVLHGIG